MKKEERNGIIWTGAERLVGQALGFVQGVILARLLSPNDFGLAAMLGIFLGVGSSLSDSGLGNALIAFGGSRQVERKVFSWNVGIGILFYVLLALIAPWVADFYAQPVLKPLMLVIALTIPINAACVIGNARLVRGMRFGALSRMNIALGFISFLLGVGLAYLGWGVWAIAWMNVVWALARLVALFHIAAPRKTGESIKEDKTFGALLSYGLKLTASELFAMVYHNSFSLVIGKVATAASVGVYMRGQRWSSLAGDVVNMSIGRVSFAAFSRGEGGAVRYLILNILLVWPCLLCLGVFAIPIVRFVLGEAWLDAVPYLRILIVGAAFVPISTISVNVLKASGRAGDILKSEMIKRPLAFFYLAVGACFGIVGICWAKVGNDITEALINLHLAMRQRWWQHFLSYRDRIEEQSLRKRIATSHRSRKLWKLMEDKSIAVVGNGPSEIGKGSGTEIDAHDIVIRINNYVTEGYEADYGKRMDVWMKGGARDVKPELRDESIRAVLYTDDILKMGVASGTIPFVVEELKARIVDFIPAWRYWLLAARLRARPTSGAVLIDNLRRVKGTRVDAYGFSFLQEAKPFSHYAETESQDVIEERLATAHHNITRESHWLARQFDGRRLK